MGPIIVYLLAALTPPAVSVFGATNSPALAIARDASRVRIDFDGALQSAASLDGPWIELTNAVSPARLEPSSTRQFFRSVQRDNSSIFGSPDVVNLLVSGPLQDHFNLAFAGTPDGIFPPHREKRYFDAALTLGALDLAISLRVRGNSSLQECPFPKLKFKAGKDQRPGTPFEDAREVKIGTHCAEGGRGNIGRLRDERAAFREVLVYESMAILGFVGPRVRRANIEYRDTSATNTADSAGWILKRKAFLLDDIEVVADRLGGRALDDAEITGFNKTFDAQLVTELELFHALAGNWDYALTPGGEGVRNTDIIELPNGQFVPVAGDFDLASWVTGVVRGSAPNDYRPDLGDVERQARYQVEQIELRSEPALFAAAAARFDERRNAIETNINSSVVDDEGRANARRHVEAFFAGLSAVTLW